MAMRSLTTLLGGAMLAAVLAPAGTAYAAATTVSDETADVWESVYDEESDTTSYVSAGSVDNVDVEALRVRHLTNRIVLRAHYVELNKGDVVLAGFGKLRFDDGPTVGINLDTYFDDAGESDLFRVGSGDPIECANFDHTIDYADDYVEFTVPRRCVGEPRWVEANYVGLGNMEDDSVDGGYRNYRDNALNAGHTFNEFTARVRRG